MRGYRRYLELCCDTTGWLYAKIDRTRLTDCRRLMYRRPADFAADGLPIDYRSATLDIGACLDQIADEGPAFDIILVDSWHEYETSRRDLDAAFRLIGPGGTLVVHDCLPPRAEIAGPDFREGEWCGVSYQAYIDFVTARDDLAYCTVDVDYGCGVIEKLAAPTFWRGARRACRSPQAAHTRGTGESGGQGEDPRVAARGEGRRPHGLLRSLKREQAGAPQSDLTRRISHQAEDIVARHREASGVKISRG